MKPFTVFFTHNLPLKMGVAAYHMAHVEADTAEAAGDRCKRMVGGHATTLAVLEGHHTPLIIHERVWTKEKLDAIPGDTVITPDPPKRTIRKRRSRDKP